MNGSRGQTLNEREQPSTRNRLAPLKEHHVDALGQHHCTVQIRGHVQPQQDIVQAAVEPHGIDRERLAATRQNHEHRLDAVELGAEAEAVRLDHFVHDLDYVVEELQVD